MRGLPLIPVAEPQRTNGLRTLKPIPIPAGPRLQAPPASDSSTFRLRLPNHLTVTTMP